MKINNDQILALEPDDQKVFLHEGCGNCGNGLGNDVFNCYANFKKDDGKWEYYEIFLCHKCLCAYHNGDDLDESCKNRFNI